jgi:general secretion pathway protein A
MYLSFYSLKRKPFEITVDPDFLWLGEKHKEALATLEYGIREDKGFLLLTGDVGTGKTVLINSLVRNIELKSIISTVPDPGLELIDFFNFLAVSFKLGRKIRSKGEFLALLKKFLIKAEATKRKVLLLVDEAQRLNHDLLEEIRLLSNIEMENRKLINIFFVGQTEFNHILLEPRNRAVRQRIAVRYQVEPLSQEETAQYILHRLKVAGGSKKIFTAPAMKEVFAFTGGNPRLTNIICDHALLSGYAAERKTIDVDIIQECADEIRLPDENPSAPINLTKPIVPKEIVSSKVMVAPKAAVSASKTLKTPAVKQSSISTLTVALLIAATILTAGYFMFSGEQKKGVPWSPDELAPQRTPVITSPTAEQSNSEPQTPTNKSSGVGSNSQPEETPTSPKSNGTGALAKNSPVDNQEAIFNLSKVKKVVIRFKSNSNELPEEAYLSLDRFAAALLNNPDIFVAVKGYTDDRGVLSYNMSVSEFRANIIKSYLVGKGVSPGRITVAGMGPENPISSNETAEGRSINRRVEIEFGKKPTAE